jgi:hypothetical protein
MGLLDKLQTQGSNFTKFNGATPPINPLSTKQSKLHANGAQPGYSLNGANASEVGPQYNFYDDGTPNSLPKPSALDTNGVTPNGPLSNPTTIPINNTFINGQYLNNLPTDLIDRATDVL